MARPPRPGEEPTLFDLPLAPEAPARRSSTRKAPVVEPAQEPLGFEPAVPSWEDESLPAEEGEEPEPAPLLVRTAELGERWRSGVADLALHLAVGLAALVGADLLGARPDVADFPAVGLFLLAFSLFYTAVPLAFWGATPGMAWVGLVCRAEDGQTLTFGQTFRHWLGTLLTLVLLGLPTLLGMSGRRAFSDRLAGTHTYREHF